jgi:hypothetical protein
MPRWLDPIVQRAARAYRAAERNSEADPDAPSRRTEDWQIGMQVARGRIESKIVEVVEGLDEDVSNLIPRPGPAMTKKMGEVTKADPSPLPQPRAAEGLDVA